MTRPTKTRLLELLAWAYNALPANPPTPQGGTTPTQVIEWREMREEIGAVVGVEK